jgi:hypothetical protein
MGLLSRGLEEEALFDKTYQNVRGEELADDSMVSFRTASQA